MLRDSKVDAKGHIKNNQKNSKKQVNHTEQPNEKEVQ